MNGQVRTGRPGRAWRAALLGLCALALLPRCSEARDSSRKQGSAGGDASVQVAGRMAATPELTTPTDPSLRDYVGPTLPRATVVLTDAFGEKHSVDVEVAATHPARTRGLMWRNELAEGTGMIFLFDRDSTHSFWMRNTLISLDMLFLSAAGEVVGIVQRAEPHSLAPRGVPKPSRYVLEVPAGWAEKKNVRVGSKAELRGISMIPIEG